MFITEELLRGRQGDWEADAFQLTLYTLALGLQAKLVYEIGVGQSTLALLRAVQRTGGRVVSCDTNPKMREFVEAHAPDALDCWEFHAKTSEDMLREVCEQSQLSFFDGCHSHSCILWEVENYWTKLAVEGLMVLHDIRDWPGPYQVMELAKKQGLETLDLIYSHGLGIIRKRPTDHPTNPLRLDGK